jgi:hypothetical protein
MATVTYIPWMVGQFEVNIASMIDRLGHVWHVNMELSYYHPLTGIIAGYIYTVLVEKRDLYVENT